MVVDFDQIKNLIGKSFDDPEWQTFCISNNEEYELIEDSVIITFVFRNSGFVLDYYKEPKQLKSACLYAAPNKLCDVFVGPLINGIKFGDSRDCILQQMHAAPSLTRAFATSEEVADSYIIDGTLVDLFYSPQGLSKLIIGTIPGSFKIEVLKFQQDFASAIKLLEERVSANLETNLEEVNPFFYLDLLELADCCVKAAEYDKANDAYKMAIQHSSPPIADGITFGNARREYSDFLRQRGHLKESFEQLILYVAEKTSPLMMLNSEERKTLKSQIINLGELIGISKRECNELIKGARKKQESH